MLEDVRRAGTKSIWIGPAKVFFPLAFALCYSTIQKTGMDKPMIWPSSAPFVVLFPKKQTGWMQVGRMSLVLQESFYASGIFCEPSDLCFLVKTNGSDLRKDLPFHPLYVVLPNCNGLFSQGTEETETIIGRAHSQLLKWCHVCKITHKPTGVASFWHTQLYLLTTH